MAATGNDQTFRTDGSAQGARLDAVLRHHLGDVPWSRARALVETGKVAIEGRIVIDPGALLRVGQLVELRMAAPRPVSALRLESSAIVHTDSHVVVVRKPAGLSTVPFEPEERNTLRDLVRVWLNRTARARNDRTTGDLGVVHRIDKDTSGLLVFTRSLAAKRHLANQMRFHTVERRYLAVVHGHVEKRTYRSFIVADRGDGFRGSTRLPNVGQEAITHVEPVATFAAATLLSCRLETGRTHQIRIHLSEAGHPLVGERVYIRNAGIPLIDAPRMMLHAAVLGFTHPASGKIVRFEDGMPDDMRAVVERLRAASSR